MAIPNRVTRPHIIAALIVVATLSVGGWNSAGPARGTRILQATKVDVRYLSVPTYWETRAPAVNDATVAFAGQPHQVATNMPIYLRNVRRWRPSHLLNSRPEAYVYTMALSARWLAWVGITDEKMGFNGQWEVYAVNLATERKYTIDSWRRRGLTAASSDPPSVSLSGNTVAWSYVDCAANCGRYSRRLRSDILVKALPYGRQRILRWVISACEESVASPSIAGHIVVWRQGGLCGSQIGSGIVLDNLATGNQRYLTHNRSAFDPVTNGRYVAWEQWPAGATRSDYGAIILLNLRTGRTTVASRRPPWRKGLGYCAKRVGAPEWCADGPVISDAALAWETSSSAVEARDLRTGREYVVAVASKYHSPETLGQPSGHTVAWADCHVPNVNAQCHYDLGLAEVP